MTPEQSVDAYTLLLWSTLFYVLENFSSAEIAEPELEVILKSKLGGVGFLEAQLKQAKNNIHL